ncbi:uncharacterized protein GGS22DRAFT_152566 [Annulohypoxylon maeteangense]|uniref:uncharacterized protein n=1 Tax=Annulohypoxylon maeteangense TaxID=1927788 RepID=UPI00200723C6|nr:uncharacterized protein GGS22DRAFT_152566 [Annulohypoxylon maeteangense]KAI0888869.1 hypothetical protein GGS22DRAFT_152566 [Annulohypoxylon maeteangense]
MSSSAPTPASTLTPASAAAKKPKSILKKPSTRATPSTSKSTRNTTTTSTAADFTDFPMTPFPITEHAPTPSQKPTARDLAIQQALVIQAQRDHEDRIQDSIIELARLPLSPPSNTSSARPSPSDTAHFLSTVRLFQPSEYEDLILERNALSKCGYCLCPNPRIKLSGGGSFKLLNYGRADFSIVPRGELERWCSRQCARRAMYVKVQLVETSAAERAGVESIQIELLEEEEKSKSTAMAGAGAGDSKGEKHGDDPARRVAKELRDLEDKGRKATRDAKELALERGDKTDLPSATNPVTVTIREKKVIMAAQEPSLDTDDDGHLILDGYKTKFDPKADADEDEK